MSLSANDLSVADASRLASKFNLAGVHFSGIKAQTIAHEEVGTADLGWTLMPLEISWALFLEAKQLRVVIPVTLQVVRVAEGADATAIADLGVLLRLDYAVVESGESDTAIGSFVGISSCLHAWPYIRAEIQNLSTKIGLPPLVLPAIVSGHMASVVGKVSAISEGAPQPQPRRLKARRKKQSSKGSGASKRSGE